MRIPGSNSRNSRVKFQGQNSRVMYLLLTNWLKNSRVMYLLLTNWLSKIKKITVIEKAFRVEKIAYYH